MAKNAQWVAEGTSDTGALFLYFASTDLADPKKATRRASRLAKTRWHRKGHKAVRVTSVRCIG